MISSRREYRYDTEYRYLYLLLRLVYLVFLFDFFTWFFALKFQLFQYRDSTKLSPYVVLMKNRANQKNAQILQCTENNQTSTM